MEKSRIKIGFKSKTQLPLLMIIKEWYDSESKEVTFAKSLFEIWFNKKSYFKNFM